MERLNLLTPAEAALRLGVSADLVRYLCDKGRLPAVRVGRGWRLIPAEDVERLAAEREAARRTRRREVHR